MPDLAELPETVVPIRTAGARPPLFCIHPASGSAYSYLALADVLDPEQPIYGFEAPGYDDDREPATSLSELAAYYVDILREHWPRQPVCLLGWSLGGVVAFDMAKRLTADGVEVPRVVMVDAELPDPGPLPSERAMQLKFMQDLMSLADTSPPQLATVFAGVAQDADPADTFAKVEAASLLPPELDAELLAHRYDIYRTHVKAIYAYRIEGTYDGPVTLARASNTDPVWLNWAPHTPQLQEHTISGDHHSIWTGAGLASLGRIVSASLELSRRQGAELGG
jgi:thioesterase domain-containing protein